MKHLKYAFIAIYITVLAANAADTVDNQKFLVKKAILKLIKENKTLAKRVSKLEETVNALNNNTILHKKTYTEYNINPFFFKSEVKSFIRRNHFVSKFNKRAITKKGNRYLVKRVACYKGVGFWGKTIKGWIYISNPKYGKFVSKETNLTLPMSYKTWCKE